MAGFTLTVGFDFFSRRLRNLLTPFLVIVRQAIQILQDMTDWKSRWRQKGIWGGTRAAATKVNTEQGWGGRMSGGAEQNWWGLLQFARRSAFQRYFN